MYTVLMRVGRVQMSMGVGGPARHRCACACHRWLGAAAGAVAAGAPQAAPALSTLCCGHCLSWLRM